MRRTITQILTLALFLFLAAFSSVWFSGSEEKPESFVATASTASKVWGLLGSLVRFASPSPSSMAPGVRGEVAIIAASNADLFGDRLPTEAISDETINVIKENMDPLQSADAQAGFMSFVNSIFTEAPDQYLDSNLYNHGLREFLTFYWFKVKGENQ